jgi:hypothetical protein
MEHFTQRDSGIGSTGKGTIRALAEGALGTNTGAKDKGYCAVMQHAALEAVKI